MTLRRIIEQRALAVADSDALRGPLWRFFYEWLAARQPDGFAVMNYGFAVPGETAGGDGDAFGLRLYDEVVAGTDLDGKRLLEVGCGRAGGLLHVAARCRPREACGVDYSRRAVALAARRAASNPAVRVVHGAADALPFPDAAFDAVLNVESSHCYPSRPRFFREVRRVLAPGGRFLFTDLFPSEALPEVRAALAEAGLAIAAEHDITANVAEAMRLDEARRLALIGRLPRLLRGPMAAFAGSTQSPMYESFVDGRRRYVRFEIERAG